MITIKEKQFKLFLNEAQIQKAIAGIASQINQDYREKRPYLVCVLNGAFMFAADLVKKLTIETEIDFVKYTSYQGMNTTGNVSQSLGFSSTIRGKEVILLEDIVDTGLTAKAILQEITQFSPASVKLATLLFKPEALQTSIPIDYVGLEIENKFIVGYGMDYDGLARNLKDIYVLQE
ncbi:hypoxanthine phosphoribosyltransferase [Rapidithrix thailandica]|uniref:Hypoxanthine phosphoribosyltransferase n=1 Tax=Rapidithrix thailandica TaxID=413964 RepID=A0AAW9RYV4_9BACT